MHLEKKEHLYALKNKAYYKCVQCLGKKDVPQALDWGVGSADTPNPPNEWQAVDALPCCSPGQPQNRCRVYWRSRSRPPTLLARSKNVHVFKSNTERRSNWQTKSKDQPRNNYVFVNTCSYTPWWLPGLRMVRGHAQTDLFVSLETAIGLQEDNCY